jgi:small subunit ribosomal protein S20
MAHHKSAIKRIKTNERSRQYNKHYKSDANAAVKSVLGSKSKKDGSENLNTAFKKIDQLVHKNILHKNKAAHQKSHLSKYVNSL